MRQRVGVNVVVGDEVLVQLVGRGKPQLAFGALAHAVTIALLALLVLVSPGAGPGSGLGATAAAQQRDPLRDQLWHLDRVHAEDAWRVARGEGITVAVVDTGVDASHPDLAGKVLRGIDLVDEGTPPDDPNGHGTLVAGVIAAVEGNGLGVAGASPGARVLPVRVLDAKGNGDSDGVARGIRWAADNGAHVINLSLAEVPGLLSLGGLLGSEMLDAIRYADERGAVVVAAAGNGGRSTTPYPSDLPLVVVGATDQRDQVWAKSNRDARTVFAPGVGIVSTWQDHGYGQANGTSFATPIVAAEAALLRQRGLTAAEVRGRIESSTTSVGAGRGRVDFARALGVEPAATAGPSASPAPASPTPAPPGQPPDQTAAPSPGQPAPTGGAAPSPGEVGPEDPSGVDAPATVMPLPPEAGRPESAPAPDTAPDLEVEVGPGLEASPGEGMLRWIGVLALVGVIGAFARAARRP